MKDTICPQCLTSFQWVRSRGRFCTPRCAIEHAEPTSLLERLNGFRAIDEVTSCWNWTGLKNETGYGQIKVGSRRVRVHRLVAHLKGILDIKGELEACHTCDNPSCFNPDHLFAASHRENMQDRAAKGRYAGISRGEAQGSSKLTEDQVRQIRIRAEAGEMNTEIARAFSVAPSTIGGIVKRHSWRHVI